MPPRTFLITGVSSGFGRAFAERVLAAGDQVVGTVRSSVAAADFEQLAAGRAHARLHVTAVEPGAFRTEWSGRSMRRAKRTVADYDEQIDTISAARAAYNGKQPGDPAKAGDAILALLDADQPPTHVLLGSDAAAAASKALNEFGREMETWAQLTGSTDYTGTDL